MPTNIESWNLKASIGFFFESFLLIEIVPRKSPCPSGERDASASYSMQQQQHSAWWISEWMKINVCMNNHRRIYSICVDTTLPPSLPHTYRKQIAESSLHFYSLLVRHLHIWFHRQMAEYTCRRHRILSDDFFTDRRQSIDFKEIFWWFSVFRALFHSSFVLERNTDAKEEGEGERRYASSSSPRSSENISRYVLASPQKEREDSSRQFVDSRKEGEGENINV